MQYNITRYIYLHYLYYYLIIQQTIHYIVYTLHIQRESEKIGVREKREKGVICLYICNIIVYKIFFIILNKIINLNRLAFINILLLIHSITVYTVYTSLSVYIFTSKTFIYT